MKLLGNCRTCKIKCYPSITLVCTSYTAWKCVGCTIFALGNVAALVASLWVGGVAPRTDAVSIWIPAVVQLQAISGCGRPPETCRGLLRVTDRRRSHTIQLECFFWIVTHCFDVSASHSTTLDFERKQGVYLFLRQTV